jgi:hypothetical protein
MAPSGTAAAAPAQEKSPSAIPAAAPAGEAQAPETADPEDAQVDQLEEDVTAIRSEPDRREFKNEAEEQLLPTEASGSFVGDDTSVVLDHPVYGIDHQGMLRVKGTGELVVSSSGQIQGLNEEAERELQEIIVRHVQLKMKKELNYDEVMVPTEELVDMDARPSTEAEHHPTCNIFMSPKFEEAEHLLLFVHSSKGIQPGIWSRSLCLRSGIQAGSMLSYFKTAVEANFASIVLNPNTNMVHIQRKDGSTKKVPIPMSSTPEEHLEYVWSKFVQPSKAKKIFFLSYGMGGVYTKKLVAKHENELKSRLGGLAFIESYHRFEDRDSTFVKEVLAKRAVNWLSSASPVCSTLPEEKLRSGCVCLSAGQHASRSTNLALTINSVREHVFRFLAACSATNFCPGEGVGLSTLFAERVCPPRKASTPGTYWKSSLPETAAADLQQDKTLQSDDFDLLKVIGKGAFGKVMLVRKKTGHHYHHHHTPSHHHHH